MVTEEEELDGLQVLLWISETLLWKKMTEDPVVGGMEVDQLEWCHPLQDSSFLEQVEALELGAVH